MEALVQACEGIGEPRSDHCPDLVPGLRRSEVLGLMGDIDFDKRQFTFSAVA